MAPLRRRAALASAAALAVLALLLLQHACGAHSAVQPQGFYERGSHVVAINSTAMLSALAKSRFLWLVGRAPGRGAVGCLVGGVRGSAQIRTGLRFLSRFTIPYCSTHAMLIADPL